MSNSLVNGFSDIIAAPNLATNGAFMINQRGNFSSATAVSVNDFVSDAWKCITNNIDYIEATNSSEGYLLFEGYGKKGQYVEIYNSDKAIYGLKFIGTGDQDKSTITASVNAHNDGGVPVDVWVRSRAYTSSYTVLNENRPIVKSGERKVASRVVKTITTTFNTAGYCGVKLVADGNFKVYISNYQEIAGAYRNVPDFAPVPYADDFTRCEKYYQVGSASGASYIPFRTKMSGTPTITLSSGSPSSIDVNGCVTSGTGVHTWSAEV